MRAIGLLLAALTAVVVSQSQNQNREDGVNRVFNLTGGSSGNDFDDLYEEVSKAPQESLGALERCGEGSDAGLHRCVSYHLCDGTTRTIKPEGALQDRFGLLNNRINTQQCGSALDVCCGIPERGGGTSERPREPDVDVGPPVTPPTRPPTRPSPTTEAATLPPFTAPNLPAGCGVRNTNGIDFKLVGNNENEAEYGEFPWMVAILKTGYNPQVDKVLAICGGSLIAPNAVLTGAHCVYKYKTNEIKIRAGEWDTQTQNERLPYQERRIARIIIHPDFKETVIQNDYALLILESPVVEAEHIKTICLPRQDEVILSSNCIATGWGKEYFGKESRASVILKKIDLPVVPVAQCQAMLRKTRLGQNFVLDSSFMCAGGKQGKDACTGDGGSPLTCPDPSNPSRYVQVGIVAWGIGCGEQGIPGVYADVAKARNWIDRQLRQLGVDTSAYVN